MMKSVLGAGIVALTIAMSAGAQAKTPGWQAANQAMGQAMEADDGKAAHRHSLEALRLYMKEGAPSEQVLVNLAINVADVSLGWETGMDASIRELKKAVSFLAGKGASTGMSRIYLHNALISLGKRHGKWDQEVQHQHQAMIGATRDAYGPDHPALAYAHVEYARFLQRMITRGVATHSLEAARRITDALPPDNMNRPSILRMLAMYHMEGRRYSSAIQLLEEAQAFVSPEREGQQETWRQVMGTLAAAYSRRSDWNRADAVVAQIIAHTKKNPAPEPLIMWMPDPLEDWNERNLITTARAHFDIGPDGRAVNIRGERVEGNPQYASYVADAMKRWRWVPVIRNGVPELSTGHSQSFTATRERVARTGSRLP